MSVYLPFVLVTDTVISCGLALSGSEPRTTELTLLKDSGDMECYDAVPIIRYSTSHVTAACCVAEMM